MPARLSLILAAVVLASLSCFLFPAEPEPQKRGEADRPTPVQTLPPPSLALRLPNGQQAYLPVVSCTLPAAGGDFTIDAQSGDPASPEWIQVQVSGFYIGPGSYDSLSVSITLGPQQSPFFSGSSLNAAAEIEADGSGQIERAAITNAASSSAFYEYGSEYHFSASWTCLP